VKENSLGRPGQRRTCGVCGRGERTLHIRLPDQCLQAPGNPEFQVRLSDRSEGGGLDDALGTGVAGGAQDAER